ncbi:unnamed protein product, partial [Allacma fusca]
VSKSTKVEIPGMAYFLRFPHALSEAMTEYEPEELKQGMRRAGYIHDVKRRLAILDELRGLDEETGYQKPKTIQELIVNNKCRRQSGKKLQRAQCRKEKRRHAIDRDIQLRFPEEVLQAKQAKEKKSEKRRQWRKMCRCVKLI